MSSRLSVLKGHVTSSQPSLMEQARSRGQLDTEELKDLLFGPTHFNKYIQPYLDYIDQNRHIFSHHSIEGHSLSEQRIEAAKMLLALRKFKQIDMLKEPLQLVFVNYAIGMFNGGICVKSLLHYFLYAKSLLLYQSNQKHTEFYNRAISGEEIGCFSLTQFGHGSYSKGIETLAIYDRKTDEFVLTTQGTKGMKFWIGALGEIANVTVVWAQLIVDGEIKGPHPFYLPIRCKKTHSVLPGIIIGDCGPKKGLNYIDNGSMILQDVRIPRVYLLGKYGYVDEKGKYQSPLKDYGARFGVHMSALSAGRGFLAMTTNTTALNAATIALRYAFSRKQFQANGQDDEIPIISYPLTKIRLIPQIATYIVQIPGSRQISTIYSLDQSLLKDEWFMNQMHALSAAIKARYSWNTLKGSQECRTILGGHGYSAFSRIPSIVDDIDVNVTWEGDNHLLLQQTSKYLIKMIPKKAKSRILDLTFVHENPTLDFTFFEQNIEDLDVIEKLVQDLFRRRYQNAQLTLVQLRKIFNDPEQIDHRFHSQIGKSLALCYADCFTYFTAKKTALAAKNSPLRWFLSDCLRLWGLSLLQKQSYGSQSFRSVLQRQIMRLSEGLVDRAVVATDALTPSSFVMGSPFGDFKGEGFKEYLSNLFSRAGTFERASYYKEIKEALLK